MSGADVLKVWHSSPGNSFQMGHANFGINETDTCLNAFAHLQMDFSCTCLYTSPEVVSTTPYIYTEISVYVLFQEDY
jgi:hypothetical protein